MLTEVVANALRHGEPPVTVVVTWLAGTARVVVRSAGPPFRWRGRPARPTEDGGWGLVFVDAMADRWGINTSPHQNEVWLELDH